MYRDLQEQDLAKFCSRGDRLAEKELYNRYAAKIYTLCRRYLGDTDETYDVFQESLMKSFDKIATFNYIGKGSLYAWISRIAVNNALNHIRKKRSRPLYLEEVFNHEIEDIPDLSGEEIQSIPNEKLLEMIARLSDMRRAVFNLYCLEEYSHREIGKMLGISEKGSAGILAKARKQLKEEIKHHLNDSE